MESARIRASASLGKTFACLTTPANHWGRSAFTGDKSPSELNANTSKQTAFTAGYVRLASMGSLQTTPTEATPAGFIRDKSNYWGAKRSKAIDLIAADFLTLQEIAENVGVKYHTLVKWTEQPTFRARLAVKRKEIADRVLERGVASKVERIKKQNERWDKLHQIIQERAQDPIMQSVPGGSTGLLSHDQKGIGSGMAATIVDVFEVDTGLLSEIRAHEDQVAESLGQIPRHDATSLQVNVNAVVVMPSHAPESRDEGPVIDIDVVR